MLVSDEATILHADLDSFFASVEQRDAPHLRGRPVAVGGGVVLAASYEAKAFGVRTAMGGWQARRLCPGLITVPARFDAYTEASRAVFEVFDDTSPLVEGLSIDEAFIDVRGMRRIAGSPQDIAARLRRRGREEGGLPITLGVAGAKFPAQGAGGGSGRGSACRSPSAWRGRSSAPGWRAAWPSRPACSSCRRTASSRSCTPCPWSDCGALAARARPSSTPAASPPWARSPSSPRCS